MYTSGDYQGAIFNLTKAIEIGPREIGLFYLSGNAKLELKDLQGAIVDFSKAIAVDPKYDGSYYYRGVAKGHLKDYQGACVDFKRAASLGNQKAAQYLNNPKSAWCRNMQ